MFLGDIPRVFVLRRLFGSTVKDAKTFLPKSGKASSEGSGIKSPSKVPACPDPKRSVVNPVPVEDSLINLLGALLIAILFFTILLSFSRFGIAEKTVSCVRESTS